MKRSPSPLDLDELEALLTKATPLPWEWWTSNSLRRLSGPDGKDGGVLHAFRSSDGVPDVAVREGDMELIAAAVNSIPELLRIARDHAALEKQVADLVKSSPLEAKMENARFAVGQLRHLYKQMISGGVVDTAQAARGLLGPSIEDLEAITTPLSKKEER